MSLKPKLGPRDQTKISGSGIAMLFHYRGPRWDSLKTKSVDKNWMCRQKTGSVYLNQKIGQKPECIYKPEV